MEKEMKSKALSGKALYLKFLDLTSPMHSLSYEELPFLIRNAWDQIAILKLNVEKEDKAKHYDYRKVNPKSSRGFE